MSHVADLSVSSLFLHRDQTFRGRCILVPRGHHLFLHDIPASGGLALMSDLNRASMAIAAAVRPDIINTCSLGNVIRHLHWHLIPRFEGDPAWGGPPWDGSGRQALELSTEGRSELAALIRQNIPPIVA